MNPKETVALTRYVRAMCPQQKFDEYTADAWHDVLVEYDLQDARAAAVDVAKRQPFVSPAEIIAVIRQRRDNNAREIQGPGLPAAVPDADPDDIPAYLAALREQRTRAGDGRDLKPRPVAELVAKVGRDVPADGASKGRGPMGVACPHCQVAPLRACTSEGGRRLGLFHPSRIESAKRAEAGLPPVDPREEQAEVERRRRASLRAVADLDQTTTDLAKEA